MRRRDSWMLAAATLLAACGPAMGVGDGGGPDASSDSGGDAPSGSDAPTRNCRMPAPAAPNTGDCADPCACAERGPPSFACEGSGNPAASANDAQREALLRSNHWRTAAGLVPFDGQAQIDQAAQAHARFMATTPRSTCWPGVHNEVMGAACVGFTGASPGDRMATAGYPFSGWGEVINWERSPTAAVDGWIWTVYHRQPFFSWRLPEVGFATQMGPIGGTSGSPANHNVMDFGTPRGGGGIAPPGPAVFPLPGQTDVPPAFRGDLEGPTPPGPGGGTWPRGVSSGTVISVHFPSAAWTIATHQLFVTGACSEVAHTFNTHMNDANLRRAGPSNDVFMYANQALAAGTEYVVRVTGTWNGAPWGRTWAFTTR